MSETTESCNEVAFHVSNVSEIFFEVFNTNTMSESCVVNENRFEKFHSALCEIKEQGAEMGVTISEVPESVNTLIENKPVEPFQQVISEIKDMRTYLNEKYSVKSDSTLSEIIEKLELPTSQNAPRAIGSESVVDELNNNLNCEFCDQHFNSYSSYSDHKRIIHYENSEKAVKKSLSAEKTENETNFFKSDSIIKLQNDNLTCIVVDSAKKFEEEIELHPLQVEQRKIRKILKKELCSICSREFSCRGALSRHRRDVHKIAHKVSHYTRCLECNIIFEEMPNLRTHLQTHHNMNMEPVKMSFSSFDEFLSWKSNVERNTLTKYLKRSLSKDRNKKYVCSRSGRNYENYKYKGKKFHRMKRLRFAGKMGINCTSEIILSYSPKNKILVEFYPSHYGHGKEMAISQISCEEQEAVKELTSQGIPLEKLIEELNGSEIVDKALVITIKRRYMKWVKHVYQTDDYNTDISDAECVTKWIQKCCSLDECPILYCHQENIGCSDEKFILFIMTEFQKHIFLSSSKDIICIDIKQRHLKDDLVVVMIMDELNTAFPVAYCLTNALNKDVLTQFFNCIKETIGNLKPKFLVSNYREYIYNSWVQVMGCGPRWLWSRWHIFHTIKNELRRLVKGNQPKRCELFNVLEIIVDCKSESIFQCMFNKFMDKLENDKDLNAFKNWVAKNLCSATEKWASCYRPEISCLTSFHLEAMHYAFVVACELGSKRRKSKFLSVLMTVLRNKMFDLLINSADNLKISLATNAIDICHARGMTIPEENITPLSNKLWLIQDEDGEEEFVTQDFIECLDHCSLKCEACTVCVHQFSCSCLHNMIDANICRHIHAVAIKVIDHPDPSKKEVSREDSMVVEDDITDVFTFPEGTACSSFPQSNSSSSFKTSASSSYQSLSAFNHSNTKDQLFDEEHMKGNNINSKILNKNGEISTFQKVLLQIKELYNKVEHNNFEPETLQTIQTHINICHDLASTKDPKVIRYKPKKTMCRLKSRVARNTVMPSFEHPQKRKTSLEEKANKLKIIACVSRPTFKMPVSEFLKKKGVLVTRLN